MNTKDGVGEGKGRWKSAPMFLLAYTTFIARLTDLKYIIWITYRILNHRVIKIPEVELFSFL